MMHYDAKHLNFYYVFNMVHKFPANANAISANYFVYLKLKYLGIL